MTVSRESSFLTAADESAAAIDAPKATTAQSVPSVRPHALNQDRMMCLRALLESVSADNLRRRRPKTTASGPEKEAESRKIAAIRPGEFVGQPADRLSVLLA